MPEERKRNPNETAERFLKSEIEHFTKKYDDWQKRIDDNNAEEVYDPKYDLRKVTVYQSWYWVVIFIIFFVPIGLITFMAFADNYIWLSLLVPVGLYGLFSIRTVALDRVAGISLLELPFRYFHNGPKLVPLGLFTYEEDTANTLQAELPGEQDKIFRGDEEKSLPPGMVRPTRVLFAEDENDPLPTGRQMAADTSTQVIIRIIPERFFEFIKRVPEIDEHQRENIVSTMNVKADASLRMLEILRYLSDNHAKIMGEIAGQISFNEANKFRGLVNELLLIRMRYAVVGLGINISQANITYINPGHDFNKSIQGRGKAVAERDSQKIKAEGLLTELKLKGEGDAHAIREKGQAEADAAKARIDAQTAALEAQAKALNLDQGAVLGADVQREFAQGGNMVIMPGGMGLEGLFGLAGKTMLESIKKTNEGDNGKTPQGDSQTDNSSAQADDQK